MIESPLIQELIAVRMHKGILLILIDRFGSVPEKLAVALRGIKDEERLDGLLLWAYRCPDLEAFRSRLNP